MRKLLFFVLVTAFLPCASSLAATTPLPLEAGAMKGGLRINFRAHLKHSGKVVDLRGKSAADGFYRLIKKILDEKKMTALDLDKKTSFATSDFAIIKIFVDEKQLHTIFMLGGKIIKIDDTFYEIDAPLKEYNILRSFYEAVLDNEVLWVKDAK